MVDALYTVGHSNHPIDYLIKLLKRYDIDTIVDVRSYPYSRYNPQYNREEFVKYLQHENMDYLYLGDCLGGRTNDPQYVIKGKVKYEKLAASQAFQEGLQRVINGIRQHRIVLLCAEKDPLQCHRSILITRHLREEPFNILHILADGKLETQEQIEYRLRESLGLPHQDLFNTPEQQTQRAYEIQGDRIAYKEPSN